MKALIFAISVLIVASYAQATEFVPEHCSNDIRSDAGITNICFAHKVGDEEQFVVVQYVQNGQDEVMALPVASIAPGNRGITGETSTVIVSVLTDDIMNAFFGLGTMDNIRSLQGEIYGREFFASNFQKHLNDSLITSSDRR
jgi:hypothetical protein